MATSYTKSARTGDNAIHFIDGICNDSPHAIFREWPTKDIGIDGQIELLNENDEPTGAYAHIQSKGGLSHVTKTGRYKLQADKKHFETWSKYKYPVIGIIYNPKLDNARWVSITKHLQSHQNCIETGPYVIDAPLDQPFSLEGFAKFQSYVMAHYDRLETDPAQKLIDGYFRGDITQKFECLVQLFYEYRWTPNSCSFFHQALRLEDELTILHVLTCIISYYSPYACESSDNMPEDDIPLRNLAEKCIADFGKAEIIKMLSTIDYDYDLGPAVRANLWLLVPSHLRYFLLQRTFCAV